MRIPNDKLAPLGQDADGLLHWERRFYNIESPTVFSKMHWVRRRLSLKELGNVLDLPKEVLQIPMTKEFLMEVKIPGKVRAQFVEHVLKCLSLQDLKRSRPFQETADAVVKRAKQEPPIPDTSEQEVKHSNPHDTVTVKPTKADDASIPTYLWDDKCLSLSRLSGLPRIQVVQAFNMLRDKFLLPFWKRKVARDFWSWIRGRDKDAWWRDSEERGKTLLSGVKAIDYALQASWWEWDGGSFPCFWRWDREFVREIRDGIPPRFVHEPPACMDRQRPNSNPVFADQERAKLVKVLKRGYLRPSSHKDIQSLMHYFSVPKGDNDIRMVYDGSKSGLNAASFAPWFAVPTSSSLERTVMPHTVQGDNDFGDMFLNFQLHTEMQKYTGVDGTDLLNDKEAVDWFAKVGYDTTRGVILTWDRPAMGLRGSPYQSVQTGTRGRRMILGDRNQESNPFRWDSVVVNMPGDANYDPRLPWVFKRRKDGKIAADLHTYIDDNRGTANSSEEAWNVSSRVAKYCALLGMQDAARKRRAPSMAPGAWAGTIIRTDGNQVEKMVSQERWDKTKEKIGWIQQQLEKAPEGGRARIQHKKLESIRGFLVYVTRTYQEMVPYLKGIHLTLDSWRKGRSRSGWKTEVADQAEMDDEEGDGCEFTNTVDTKLLPEELWGTNEAEVPPEFVFAIPRLNQDIGSLHQLTISDTPPVVLVRPVQVMVGYLVGDASGSGHGSSFLCTGEKNLRLAHGTWSEEASNRSSNFREFANLVRRMEQLWEQKKLIRGTELFVFTDNFVTESVFYKGAASSPYLHKLVERLRMLQLYSGLIVHVLWIAGTRMIEQGTDGLSRGDLNSGVMNGRDFLSFLPLNKSAFELSSSLEDWFRIIFKGRLKWETLNPTTWFTKAHENGHFIWAPPPAIADLALEQMCESVLCRPWNAHLFVCPAHMTHRWRKQMRRVSDLVITIPAGGSLWPASLHEPLVVGLTCPLLAYSPWRVKRTQRLVRGQGLLPKVWSEDWKIEGNILRELWVQEVPTNPDLLWGLAPRVLLERPNGSFPSIAGNGP